MDKALRTDVMISVIMPTYNCESYIEEAIDSILSQTYTNFEFIIIDDCSTDSTYDLIESYDDARIKLFKNKKNKGISNTLNYGISIAKGKYIARMDGDDISLPSRFEKQIQFLETNPNIILCGTAIKIINSDDIRFFPKNHEEIKISFLERNQMAHPSVMIRKSILTSCKVIYDSDMEPAEDYDLWIRLINAGKFHNLDKVLLHYRYHDKQISEKNRSKQVEVAYDIKFKLLRNLDIKFNFNEKEAFKNLIKKNKNISFNELKTILTLKKKIVRANKNKFFDKSLLFNYLDSSEKECFKNYFIRRKMFSPIIVFQFYTVIFKTNFRLSFVENIKLLVKSLVYHSKS